MILLGVDVETTGFDPDTDSITEIGAVLYDTDYMAPVKMLSALIKPVIKKPLEPLIIKLTGITDEMLERHGQNTENVFENFMHLVDEAEYLVAHNAPFDKGFLCELADDIGDEGDLEHLKGKHWINTCTDLPVDKELCKHSNLLYMAAYHGIVNPFSHRAVTDVLTMLQVLSKHNIDLVIIRSKSPTIRVWCKPGFNGKDAPKAAGFRYNGDDKSWSLDFKECDLDIDLMMSGKMYDFYYEWNKVL